MTVDVSILLPVYNGARFLEQQVRSLLNQTCPSYEVLVLDDASSDDSPAILRRLAAEDERLHFEVSQVNRGQHATLRALHARARGRYIAFSDQDDVWHSEKLTRLLAAMEDGVSLAYGRSELINEDGRPVGRTIFDVLPTSLEGRNEARLLLWNSISGHALLARRELVDDRIFELGSPYDWLLAAVATYADGIRLVHDAVTWHRIHGGNLINSWMLNGKPKPASDKRNAWRTRLEYTLHVAQAVASSDAVSPDKRQVMRELAELIACECRRTDPTLDAFRFMRRFVDLLDRLEPSRDARADVVRRLRSLRPPIIGSIENLIAKARKRRLRS